MALADPLGSPLNGASPDSAALYGQALHALQCLAGDPVKLIDQALAISPDFVMAHALRGYLHLLVTDPYFVGIGADSQRKAAALPASAQEAGHVAALGHLAAGGWHAAGRVLEDLAIEHPRDALALFAGQQIDFFTGNARMLRDRIARALPAWSASMPGYHSVLGLYAFGLEETADYAAAERHGRHAVELEPRDGWAQHAVAHVMEMQDRPRDGIAWMRAPPQAWVPDSFFCVHNWWHLALFHLDLREIDAVLELFDGPISGAPPRMVFALDDASSLLWRLHLLGLGTGARWAALADGWQRHTLGTYAFNDVHAMMAFVGSGRQTEARHLLDVMTEAAERPDDNAAFTRAVGLPVALAIRDFDSKDYRACIGRLRSVRETSWQMGGSHAQRDVLDLTLIEAALRGGESALAAALTAERKARRPASPLADHLSARAARLTAP